MADSTMADTTLADTTLTYATLADTTLADTTLAYATLADTTLEDTALALSTITSDSTSYVNQPFEMEDERESDESLSKSMSDLTEMAILTPLIYFTSSSVTVLLSWLLFLQRTAYHMVAV